MLDWVAPTQACDDATGQLIQLQPGELGGYQINYNTDDASSLNGGSIIVAASALSAEIDELAPGTYYLSICSLDSAQSCGIPSPNCPSGSRSNVIEATVQ